MIDTPEAPPTRERVLDRAGRHKRIAPAAKERFGVELLPSTTSNWYTGKRNPKPVFYRLIAELAEYQLEQVYDAFHPDSYGKKSGDAE
ncbi:hypothetical protein ACQU0X_30925 [Pseudovibrio ascidiaceicola]|uniref:hypothetical protein n=1 Tax=Pseudovibrio ascidiaceicola TaxID=285279 RepID=UPI003D369589